MGHNSSHDRQFKERNATTEIGIFKVFTWRRRNNVTKFLCECPYCGSKNWVMKANARKAKSCGCKTKEILRKARTIHGHSQTAQNSHGTPTYITWLSMMDRCYYKQHKSFRDYGGRGIAVCKAWRDSFLAFLEDMGERPPGKTIGRINNSENYTPSNCEWQTPKEQANNRRSSRILSHGGKRMTLQQWSEHIGIHHDALCHRLSAGWSVNRTLTEQPRKQRNSRYTLVRAEQAAA